MKLARLATIVAFAGAAFVGATAPASAAPSSPSFNPGTCTGSGKVVQTSATAYAVGYGSCTRFSQTTTVELRESRGVGYVTVARASCSSAAGRQCTAITPRITKRPGAAYTYFVNGPVAQF